MLIKSGYAAWWFMEVPRTGTSTVERTLKQVFPDAKACYAKHWPILPPESFLSSEPTPCSIISVRDPFSRAVSCWQYFTMPGSLSFLRWTQERLENGWFDVHIEARPQSFWFDLWDWHYVLRQEYLNADFWAMMRKLSPSIPQQPLRRFNDINGPWVNRVRAKTSREKPWQEYYCEESRENVLRLYESDFDSLSHFYPREIQKFWIKS